MRTLVIVRDATEYTDEIRRRALKRLYTRRAAVDELIRSLELYQRAAIKAECIPLSAVEKC